MKSIVIILTLLSSTIQAEGPWEKYQRGPWERYQKIHQEEKAEEKASEKNHREKNLKIQKEQLKTLKDIELQLIFGR